MSGRRLVVVFGAAVRRDGGPSAALRHRVEAAATVARADAEADLFLTGGVGRVGPSEASVMATLLGNAVPPRRLLLDEVSLDTLQSVRAAVRTFRAGGYAGLISCTDGYHQPRIRLLFALWGIPSRAVSPARQGAAALHWRMVLREAAALPYDAIAGGAARLFGRDR